MKSKALIACSVLVAGFCAAAAAEYRPEAWNLQAREKFAEQRYGVFTELLDNYHPGNIWFDCAKSAGGVEFELPADFKADANADVFRILH